MSAIVSAVVCMGVMYGSMHHYFDSCHGCRLLVYSTDAFVETSRLAMLTPSSAGTPFAYGYHCHAQEEESCLAQFALAVGTHATPSTRSGQVGVPRVQCARVSHLG